MIKEVYITDNEEIKSYLNFNPNFPIEDIRLLILRFECDDDNPYKVCSVRILLGNLIDKERYSIYYEHDDDLQRVLGILAGIELPYQKSYFVDYNDLRLENWGQVYLRHPLKEVLPISFYKLKNIRKKLIDISYEIDSIIASDQNNNSVLVKRVSEEAKKILNKAIKIIADLPWRIRGKVSIPFKLFGS